jgi:hypothetical protein
MMMGCTLVVCLPQQTFGLSLWMQELVSVLKFMSSHQFFCTRYNTTFHKNAIANKWFSEESQLLFYLQDWIMEQWEKSYYITAIAGSTNGSSLVVMSKGTKVTAAYYSCLRLVFYFLISSKYPFVSQGLCC